MHQGVSSKSISTQPLYQISKCKLYSEEEKSFFKLAHCLCEQASCIYPLTDEFQVEFKREQIKKERYFTHKKRNAHEVKIHEGIFKSAQGNLLNGILMYVLLPNHKLYAASPQVVIHHSYLSGGLPVLASGFIFCFSGLLVTVNNNSGHYKVSRDQMTHALDWFSRMSANPHLIFEDHTLPGTQVRFYKAQDSITEDSQVLNIDAFYQEVRSATDDKIDMLISEISPETTEEKNDYTFDLYYEEPAAFSRDEFAKDDVLLRCFSSLGKNNQKRRFHSKASSRLKEGS